MESKVLVMTFKNEDGKKVNLRLSNIREDITDEEIATAMDAILAANIIVTSGGDIVAKEAAEIVVTTTSSFNVQ